MNEYIKSDLYRYYGKVNFFNFVKGYIMISSFRFQVALRLCQSHGISKYFGYFLYLISRTRKRIQISYKTKIGYGLYIGHNGPIIVNRSTTIGNNCNLSQFTTIGSNNNKAATIGDNVYIGPNCCIVEDVKIGNNVTIGAGSVVTKDIPNNATAAGNYAKVINYNKKNYIQNQWIVDKK